MRDDQKRGIVFNIQKFSVHDGTGIRTLIFFKGCPLRCRWCGNPESQNPKPERAFNPSRCLAVANCGKCVDQCPDGALSRRGNLLAYDPAKCLSCFACVDNCPAGAQTRYGSAMSVAEILKKVEEDEVFYGNSGGGLTLSGGEALLQREFAVSLLREARKRHMNTALETCGFYPYEAIHMAAEWLDELFYDIKCLDSHKHKEWTGADNAIILANLMRLRKDCPDLPIRVRTPVIPGFNDSEKEIAAIRDYLSRLGGIDYELLPYHRLGEAKYAYLGRKYKLADARLDESLMERLREIARTPYCAS